MIRIQKLKQQGFTLVEFVMVAVIVAVIAVVLSKMLFHSYKAYVVSNDIHQADWQALLATQRIAEDVHRIASSQSIHTIQAQQFGFTDVAGSAVSYQLANNQILRNGVVLAKNISQLNFAYLNAAGNIANTTTTVRYVRISLQTTVNDIQVSMGTLAGTRFNA